MNSRLVHDVCFTASVSIVEVFIYLLREEERKDAFDEIYARVKAAVEIYEIKRDTLKQKINPSLN